MNGQMRSGIIFVVKVNKPRLDIQTSIIRISIELLWNVLLDEMLYYNSLISVFISQN